MKDKCKSVDRVINKLKRVMYDAINNGKYETAMATIATSANILYEHNQYYVDNDLEDAIGRVATKTVIMPQNCIPNNDVVLFYDGFGLDLRGWAASYIRALNQLGYNVIYVTTSDAIGRIPHLLSEMVNTNSKAIYFDQHTSYLEKVEMLTKVFIDYRPKCSFFYTLPYDVAAAVVFNKCEFCKRIQVDLTDHAFWIGKCAFDYILECREMGASIAKYYRGVSEDKIIKLDVAPYINKEICEEPLPFDIHREKYIFTGGALYKTFGDPELLYYRSVRHTLSQYSDVYFLYAGTGDDTEIQKLSLDFPDRVFLIGERPDYFRIIEDCLVYINSYPMFGGLMMRYAALAGKIPLTLKHNHDSDGLLINQESLGIEFDNFQDYIDELDKLIVDEEYREKKEHMLIDAVISEEKFTNNIGSLIEQSRTEYFFDKIDELDTSVFRKEFNERFDMAIIYRTIVTKKNMDWAYRFPRAIMLKIIDKIKEKLK